MNPKLAALAGKYAAIYAIVITSWFVQVAQGASHFASVVTESSLLKLAISVAVTTGGLALHFATTGDAEPPVPQPAERVPDAPPVP